MAAAVLCVHDGSLGLVGKLTSVAYPLGDVLLPAATWLVGPAIELIAELGGRNADLLVVIGAAVLFGLVAARMTGLVLRQRRSAERERTLGSAASALVSATTRVEIGMLGEEAAGRLAGEHASVLICRGKADGTAFSDGAGRPLAPYAVDALREAAAGPVVTLGEAACLALRLPLGRRRAVVHALGERDGLEAFLVVVGASVEQSGVRTALGRLAAQIARALERAALTEEIHGAQEPADLPERMLEELARVGSLASSF